MKKLLFSFCGLCLLPVFGYGQISSITPVLIGSSGNFSTNGGIMLSSSIGEVIVPTVTNGGYILTQGFQQPSPDASLVLNANLVYSNVSCAGAEDGTALVIPTGGTGPYQYLWTTSQNDTLAQVDSLAPGTYTVIVIDAGGLTTSQTLTITEGVGICGIHVYSGFTPNADNANDVWIIDYIDLFENTNVEIFNRWGMLVWEGKDYDNSAVVFEGRDKNGVLLPPGTYYYIIRVGMESMKGWVEISH
jgi:gliding motility-associated-like protein